MGVYFKSMKRPTNCDLCPLHRRLTTEIQCKITGSSYAVSGIPYASYQMEDCPAQEIQAPHGDLIDKGYAIATACSGLIRTLPTTEGGENWIRVTEVRESIKSAPTIIEAEEGGK